MKLKLMYAVFGTLLIASQLSACHSAAVTEAPPIRSVKLATIGPGEGGGAEVMAVVRQEKRAELSFQNEGRIAAVAVDVGDPVRAGQVLALLEDRPARLRLEQADARVRGARAQRDERREQLTQQQAMFDDGAASALTLRTAQAALEAAGADLQSAIAEQGIARHAAGNVAIRAPFDGKVAARLLQPGATVAAGQPVLRVEGAGRLQAVAALPLALSSSLKPGQTVDASLGTAPEATLRLTLRGLADRLDAGSTVEAIFDVPSSAPPLHPNQSLLLTLAAATPARPMLPLASLVPGARAGSGFVFVFHADRNTVDKRQVVVGEQRGDRIVVNQGLKAGEQVVTAGATFLTDAQKVRPYHPQTTLVKEGP